MIKVENITKIYKINRKKQTVALDDVSFTLPEKGLIFIVGKSGSGKSTLLNLIGGLDKPTQGSIVSSGNDITKLSNYNLTKYRSSYIDFIFQDYHIIDRLSVLENISLMVDNNNPKIINQIDEILQKLEIYDLKHRFPKELSGGQKQRVAIARALVNDSEVMLCDEPSGNLDKKTTKALLEILKTISKEKLVVVVSHSNQDAEVYADRIIELADGKISRDRRRTLNYNNEFRIEENKVYLPHYRDLDDIEIEQLNTYLKENDEVSFIQVNNKFVETKEVISEEKKFELYQEKITKDTSKKFLKIFMSNKISMIVNIFLAALLLVCFAIFQSFLSFDGNQALSSSLSKQGIDTVPIHKVIESETVTINNSLRRVEKEEIQAFYDAGYKGNIYKKYSQTLPINVSSTTIDNEGAINLTTNLQLFYTKETFGVINCTEDFLASIYGVDGKVKYLAKVNEPKDYGIYIPDYIADSILLTGKYNKALSYEELLGQYKYNPYCYGYINGIFDTNYEEKYSVILTTINKFLTNPADETINLASLRKDPIFEKFTIEAMNYLAYGYNFSNDFGEALKTNDFRDWIRLSRFEVSRNDEESYDMKTNSLLFLEARGTKNYSDLIGKQIALSTGAYNKMFGTEYTGTEEFVPHKIKIKIHRNNDISDKVIFEEEFEVVKLFKSSGMTLYMNLDGYNHLREYDIVNYGLILDSHYEIEKMVDVASRYNYIVYSPEINKLNTVNTVLNIFGDFFIYIELFFLLIAVLFLINIGVSSVKKNKYEIGVLKAIGVRNFDIVKSFIVQSVILAFAVAAVANIGIYIGIKVADLLMIKAFEEIIGVVIKDLVLVAYIPSVVVQDLFNIVLLSIISFIIPQILLLRIRPIEIIRARE